LAPADCERLLGADIVQFIALMRAQERSESQLISILHRVQQAFGYLSPQQMDAVAQLLQVPAPTQNPLGRLLGPVYGKPDPPLVGVLPGRSDARRWRSSQANPR
jgi:hypothetical protein